MKKLLLGLAALALIFLVLIHKKDVPADVPLLYKQTTVNIGGNSVLAEIADTESLRQQGLGGRSSLDSGTGMLFVFSTPGKQGFWMKDMLFPIDIIWANNGEVVSIENSLSPDTYPKVFYPKSDAQYVLEIPAGYALKNGINIGSKFSIGH
ncbi:MAG: hypothetical protein JWL80_565 [Parcubacteria group bacterium]|nr:hypothetical protein [Parcubacteria group bacterium]